MNIAWHHSEGATKPDEVCLNWSPKNVYLHRNIEQIEKTDEQGNAYLVWAYEEAKLSRADYAIYAAELAQANVEYVAVMTDIDLDI